jgi:two-component system response regulator FixJ
MPRVAALIAVVDDDPHVCKALQRLLLSSGYAVQTHASGTQLLERIAERMPNCIVLDLHMPDMSGLDVQTELRRRGVDVPVVIITGHATSAAYSQAFVNGASAYICKPIDAADLLAAIHGALQSSHA